MKRISLIARSSSWDLCYNWQTRIEQDYVVLSRCAPHQLVFNLRRFSRIGRFVSEIYLLMHPVDNFPAINTRRANFRVEKNFVMLNLFGIAIKFNAFT